MNRFRTSLFTGLVFILIIGFLSVTNTHAQVPPPPPNGGPGSGHGLGGNQPAGTAPIGNGTLILLVLGAAYAGRKIYNNDQE